MIELNKDNFKDEVSNGLVFVDFWGNNCQRCINLMDDMHALAEKYSDKLKFFKFNVDDNKMVAIKEKVMGLPTMIIYENGNQKTRLAPNKIESAKDIEEFIKANI